MAGYFQPSGFDRADGLDGQPGTPTPEGALLASSSAVFEEDPASPQIERGEQATFVHTFNCDEDTGLTIVEGLPRGALMTDSLGVTTRVLTTAYQQQRANRAKVVVTAEATTLDVPPDEFSVEAVEFNPSLFRHPRYASVINYSGGPLNGSQIVAIIQGSVNLPQVSSQSEAQSLISASQISNGSVLSLAQELLLKIQQGFDTFYLAGFRVTYSYYNFLPILMNPGGYIQDPVSSGALPYYFWSANGEPGGANILTSLASSVAPAFYASGVSWLRQSDYQTYQRTWFKVTQTWLGAPGGYWDSQIYNP